MLLAISEVVRQCARLIGADSPAASSSESAGDAARAQIAAAVLSGLLRCLGESPFPFTAESEQLNALAAVTRFINDRTDSPAWLTPKLQLYSLRTNVALLTHQPQVLFA